MAYSIEVNFFNSYWLKKTVDSNGVITRPIHAGADGTDPAYLPPVDNSDKDWYIEEARIRGGYNNTITDLGKKAYIVEDSLEGQTRNNAIIYSGIFNSRTGINDTNVFSTGEDITRAVDPFNGSIQKLHAEDSNLIIFQEDKVSRALIDKDAIYTAEGDKAVTTSNKVIGQIISYAGDYGISTDPLSFDVYGYQKYFTDRRRNAVLRLSQDGITEISQYGMKDWFRDNLNSFTSNIKIKGAYDRHAKQYVLNIHQTAFDSQETYYTLSFDESVRGWTSFYGYDPDFMLSLRNNFYSIKDQKVYRHHVGTPGTFYEQNAQASSVQFIFNDNVSAIKNFRTISYEGTSNWEVTQYQTPSETALPVVSVKDGLYKDIFNVDQYAGFTPLENKFHSPVQAAYNVVNDYGGRVVLQDYDANGTAVIAKSGVKGYYSTVTIQNDTPGESAELFAVNTSSNLSSN